MSNRLPKLLLLLAVTVAIAVAASPVGTLTSTGAVTVSGESLPAQGVPSWPVVSGDEIITEKGGTAVLSSAAARVEIREGSQVKLGEDHVRLQGGAVGADNYSVRFGDYTARPKDPQAGRSWFVVADRGGKQLVAAHRGDVVIRGGDTAPILVPEGSYALPPAGRREQDNDRDRGGGAAKAGSSGGWTFGSLSHGQSVALVLGLGAAGTAGAIVGLTGDEDQVAPPPPRSP